MVIECSECGVVFLRGIAVDTNEIRVLNAERMGWVFKGVTMDGCYSGSWKCPTCVKKSVKERTNEFKDWLTQKILETPTGELRESYTVAQIVLHKYLGGME